MDFCGGVPTELLPDDGFEKGHEITCGWLELTRSYIADDTRKDRIRSFQRPDADFNRVRKCLRHIITLVSSDRSQI